MVGDNDAENEDGAFKMFNPTGEHRLSMDMNQLLKQTKSRESSSEVVAHDGAFNAAMDCPRALSLYTQTFA